MLARLQHMTRFPVRLSPLHAVLAAACAFVFVALGHFAATALIDAQRVRQLHDLNETALRRAEIVADYGKASLEAVGKRVNGECNSSALQLLRLQVYQRSNLKDVRIIDRDGAVMCSAYSETLEFDKGWVRRDQMLPSGDGQSMLFRVDQFSGVALGIAKDCDNRRSIAAILSLSSSLFDLMPRDLRDHSAVTLLLNDGQVVAADREDADMAFRDPVVFSQSSQRYPFRVEMKIEATALRSWNSEPYWPIVTLAALLGLAFGALLAGAALRPTSLVTALDHALASGAIKPFFLPTFDLDTGRIVGCEVLARWIKPDGTIVPPLSFIPLAESTGRIERLTWCILEQALRELQPIVGRDRGFMLSINVMPRHMMSDGFVDRVRAVAVAHRVSPRQIALEITERNSFADLEEAARVIVELRDRGFSVALDDVGIGHNGLSQIQALGANILKIDKFFVDSICRDNAAHVTIEMLVRLAGELKMTVLAEGIEADEQRLALIACGVTEGQGYLVSPPLPAAKFAAFVNERANSAPRSDRTDVFAAQVA
jgi:sensor c-di-GMP phosphodiesterase-like protein